MTGKLASAKAVADLSRGAIVAVVEIAAAPDRIFRALTDPDELVKWWGSPDTYQLTESTADVRVGGAWRSGGRSSDGTTFSVGGEFVEIDPPRLLVQTWRPDWDGGHTTTIRYQLDPIPNGTRVTVRHEGFGDRVQSCESHANGWERVLGWLAGYAGGGAAAQAPASRYFFCRLIPPRPTFGTDMTDVERTAMRAHVAYWTEIAKTGAAVVFGPVADPAGVWGLGILRVTDADDVAALLAKDPAVIAKIGVHYDTLPLLSAITAG